MKAVLARQLQHIEVHVRILVSRETDVARLAGLLGRDQRLHRSTAREEAIGIVEANVLVELHQVDMVGLGALQRLVDLLSRFLFSAAIELRHQKSLRAVAVEALCPSESHSGLRCNPMSYP